MCPFQNSGLVITQINKPHAHSDKQLSLCQVLDWFGDNDVAAVGCNVPPGVPKPVALIPLLEGSSFGFSASSFLGYLYFHRT